MREVERIGFDCEVLSAEEEAQLAGEGVLSGIPEADGIVGDLGGGSLELVDVADGRRKRGISLPLGVLRLDRKRERRAGRAQGTQGRAQEVRLARARRAGATFYMVGGSWRALARIDMLATDYPLPITHQYRMKPGARAELRKLVRSLDPRLVECRRAAAPRDVAGRGDAARALVEELEPYAARRLDLRHPRRPALLAS